MLVPAGARYPGQSELFGRVRNGPRRLFAHAAASGNTRRGALIRFVEDALWPGANTTLVNLVGAGAPGNPADGGETRWRVMDDYQSFFVETAGSGGTGQLRTDVVSAGYTSALAAAQNTPADYDEYNYYEWGHERIHHDYYYESYSTGTAATTGASATAFNKTFLGGTGGNAAETRFENVLILPNTPYQIIVPAGGFIELTYNP